MKLVAGERGGRWRVYVLSEQPFALGRETRDVPAGTSGSLRAATGSDQRWPPGRVRDRCRRRRRGSARGWWQRGQARERGGQGVGPGPGALQAQRWAAGVEGQPAGGMQQPVAQRLGLADGELAVERQGLGPGDQVLGDQRELQPHLVVV